MKWIIEDITQTGPTTMSKRVFEIDLPEQPTKTLVTRRVTTFLGLEGLGYRTSDHHGDFILRPFFRSAANTARQVINVKRA